MPGTTGTPQFPRPSSRVPVPESRARRSGPAPADRGGRRARRLALDRDRAPVRARAREVGAAWAGDVPAGGLTSLWRAFSPPPQDWPLALCDYRSTDDAEDCTPNLLFRVPALPGRDAKDAPDDEAESAGNVALAVHPRTHLARRGGRR